MVAWAGDALPGHGADVIVGGAKIPAVPAAASV